MKKIVGYKFSAPTTDEKSAPESYKKISEDFRELISLAKRDDAFRPTYETGGPHWLIYVLLYSIHIVVSKVSEGFLNRLGEDFYDAMVAGYERLKSRKKNGETITRHGGDIEVPNLVIEAENITFIFYFEHALDEKLSKLFTEVEKQVLELLPKVSPMKKQLGFESITVELFWNKKTKNWDIDAIKDAASLLQDISYD